MFAYVGMRLFVLAFGDRGKYIGLLVFAYFGLGWSVVVCVGRHI